MNQIIGLFSLTLDGFKNTLIVWEKYKSDPQILYKIYDVLYNTPLPEIMTEEGEGDEGEGDEEREGEKEEKRRKDLIHIFTSCPGLLEKKVLSI